MTSRGAFQPKWLYVKKNFSKADISSQKNWAIWLKTTINNNTITDKNQVWFCTESSKLYKQKLIFLLPKYGQKYQGKKIKVLLLLYTWRSHHIKPNFLQSSKIFSKCIA